MRTRLIFLFCLIGALFHLEALAETPDPLTGLTGTDDLAKRNLLGVMVENTTAARPQSGLDQAGIVIESYVEGKVTRFMALFVSQDAEIIGPVRSTRQPYISIIRGYNGFLAHAWAPKTTGYGTIERLKVKNLDGVRLHGLPSPFKRIDSRPEPHNLYTNTVKLREHAKDRKYREDPIAPFFKFKTESPICEACSERFCKCIPTDPAKEKDIRLWIGVNYNGRTYFAHFQYDPATNQYYRYLMGKLHQSGSQKSSANSKENGAPHSSKSMKPIAVKNLIILFAHLTWQQDSKLGETIYSPVMTTTGKGKAYFFRDGLMVTGSWSRKNETSPFHFLDDNGEEMAVNRGKSWICLIDDEKKVLFNYNDSPLDSK